MIVRSRAVVVAAQAGLLPLAGEAPVGGHTTNAQTPIGQMAHHAHLRTARVCGETGRAKRVAGEASQHAALALGDALEVGIVAPDRVVVLPCHFK